MTDAELSDLIGEQMRYRLSLWLPSAIQASVAAVTAANPGITDVVVSVNPIVETTGNG